MSRCIFCSSMGVLFLILDAQFPILFFIKFYGTDAKYIHNVKQVLDNGASVQFCQPSCNSFLHTFTLPRKMIITGHGKAHYPQIVIPYIKSNMKHPFVCSLLLAYSKIELYRFHKTKLATLTAKCTLQWARNVLLLGGLWKIEKYHHYNILVVY